jgi:Na+-driven multidrug efflux pump
LNNVAVGKHPEKDKIGAITTTTDVSPTAHPHRQIWAIAGPAILANSSAPLVGLVDTWGIGHLPQAVHLAAVGLGSVIFSFLLWAFGFLRMSTCFRILFKCANLLAVVNNCTACATISDN